MAKPRVGMPMHRFPTLVLLLTLGAAACGGANPAPAAPRPAAPARAQVERDLARLRALDVFEVGDLVPGATPEALHRLVELAESTSDEPGTEWNMSRPEAVAEDLEALRDLHIVEVGELFASSSAADGHYYAGDPNRSENRRAARLDRIAQLAASRLSGGGK